MREFVLEGGRDAASRSDKYFFKKVPDDDESKDLTKEAATRYRATVARLNYMASEWPDLHDFCKTHTRHELARSMASPKGH